MTTEQRKEHILKLVGMTFYCVKNSTEEHFVIIQDGEEGKFQAPDGKVFRSPSGVVEHQLIRMVNAGQRRKTFAGWLAWDSNGKTLDDHIREFVKQG